MVTAYVSSTFCLLVTQGVYVCIQTYISFLLCEVEIKSKFY